MTLVPPHLVQRLIAGRPWRVPTDRLLKLVAIEIEPRTVLQIGHDLQTARLLRDVFPEASVEVREPEHVTDGTWDLIVCAFGLSSGFHDDCTLANGLERRLAPGGVLALLELVGSSSDEVADALERSGVRPRATLADSLAGSLRTLHRTEGRTWLGLWRHVLFLGRRLEA